MRVPALQLGAGFRRFTKHFKAKPPNTATSAATPGGDGSQSAHSSMRGDGARSSSFESGDSGLYVNEA